MPQTKVFDATLNALIDEHVADWAAFLTARAGVPYDANRVATFYEGVSMIRWEDSTTYMQALNRGIDQGILRGRSEGLVMGRSEGLVMGRSEGEVRATQELVLRLGTKRFGPAPDAVALAVHALADLGRLGRLAERVFDAAGWDDLLATS